jgi:hypothetical protein
MGELVKLIFSAALVKWGNPESHLQYKNFKTLGLVLLRKSVNIYHITDDISS